MKMSWKKIGFAALSAAITAAITAAVNLFTNKSKTKTQTQAALEIEAAKLKNAKELEEKRTEERKKRFKDEEDHRRKMNEIAEEQRRKHRESQQETQEQVHEDSSLDTVPNLRSTADVFNRPCGFGKKEWIVDGYAKPGQITMIVAGADVGKSSLLTQTALAVAKGVRPEYLPDSCSASLKQDVVYYRIEDFPDELEGKYGAGEVLKVANLMWVLPEDLGVISLTSFLAHVKRLANTLERDTLVCADPVTKLDGYRHEECIKGLEEAQKIAKANGVTLTIIVAAHLDEINDSKHLTTEFIKGGDKGVQQAGSVIALRMEGTTGRNHRFIQCLKAPKGHRMPFPEGVLVCKYVKTQLDEDNSYLHFEFVEVKPEADARPDKPKKPKGSKAGSSKSDNTTDEPQKSGNATLTAEHIEQIRQQRAAGVKWDDIKLDPDVAVSTRTMQRALKNLIGEDKRA